MSWRLSAALAAQEKIITIMPSWYGHSFLLALSITIIREKHNNHAILVWSHLSARTVHHHHQSQHISVIIMKITSKMIRFLLNLTAQVVYLIIICMKPIVNILGWLGKFTLHVTLSFFLGYTCTMLSVMS